MKITKTLLGAAVGALPLTLVTAPAEAQARSKDTYRNPEVAWVHNVRAVGDQATVRAKYRCWGGNEGTHLWVSLKQGGGIRGKSAEELAAMQGTSQIARAWYDTNAVDPAKTYLVCDGRWQIQKYTLGREKGTLRRGSAFLQFCLFDSTADPTGQDLSYGFAYRYDLVRVKKPFWY